MNKKIEGGAVPEGWEILNLEKGKYIKGKAPKISLENPMKGYINYLTPEYLRGNTSELQYVNIKESNICNDDDLLILWDGSNAGEIFKGKKGAIASTMVKFDINNINKYFLYYYLKNLENVIKSGNKGSGIPHVDKSIICDILFLKPKFLSEQQKIAQILSTVDETIDKTEQLIVKYEQIKMGLMEDLFTKGIDLATGKFHRKFRDSELGAVPEGWSIDIIGNVFSGIGSGTTPKSDNSSYYEKGVFNWLNTGDLNDGIINNCKRKISKYAIEKYTSLKVYPKRSLVIAMYGATIGKLGFLEIETTTNQACCVLFKSSIIDTKYSFYYFLKSKELLVSLGSGAGQPNISQELIKSFFILFPKDIQEQQKIAQILTEADNKISKEKDYKGKLEQIKKGLMGDLLMGRVRV